MHVLDTVERHSMIWPGDRIGVAVSGGADSVALLRLLAELRTQLGIQLFVLHFHHQLRGADADEDELFVARLARELGFDFLADRAKPWRKKPEGALGCERFYLTPPSLVKLEELPPCYTAVTVAAVPSGQIPVPKSRAWYMPENDAGVLTSPEDGRCH